MKVLFAVLSEETLNFRLDNSGLNIEKVVGDLNDQEFIDKVMDGVETVMHIYNIHHSSMIVQTAIKE